MRVEAFNAYGVSSWTTFNSQSQGAEATLRRFGYEMIRGCRRASGQGVK